MPKSNCLPCLLHETLTKDDWTLILEAIDVQLEFLGDGLKDSDDAGDIKNLKKQVRAHEALETKIGNYLRRVE
jgi:hypothetical protein